MIKSLKGIMGTIDGVEVYPIISLLMFFLFFAVLGWYVYKADKKEIDEIKQIPLDNDASAKLSTKND